MKNIITFVSKLVNKLKNTNLKNNKMKKLELSEKDALRLYPTADKAFKEMLEINFGVEFFNQKITDRIKSFDDILAIANEKGYKYNPNTDDTEDEVAYKKAKLIALVLNEGWEAKAKINRYYPYFSLSSGFVFAGSCYDYGCVYSASGFRLCFKNSELSDFAGKTFIEIYKKLYI